MSSLSIQEKKSLIKDLINLSEIDGEQNMSEMQFIYAIAKSFGMTDEELTNLRNEDIDFIPPAKPFDRIEHMHRLMLLMASDNTFLDVEKRFLINIGLKMGLRPEAVSALFEKMEASETNIISPEEIMEVYTIYYN